MRPLNKTTYQAPDVTTELAPKAVVEAADALLATIDERNEARATWVKAQDAVDLALDTKPPSEVEKLRTKSGDLAFHVDRANKEAAQAARDLADAIAANADAWTAPIDREVAERKERIAALLDELYALGDEVSRLKSIRCVATETRPRELAKFRSRAFAKELKEGVALGRRWLNPPQPVKSPVRGRNFGNQMSAEAREFIGHTGRRSNS